MLTRCCLLFLIGSAAVLHSQVSSRRLPSQRPATIERAQKIKVLGDEIKIRNSTDAARVTNDLALHQLDQVRKTVQAEVLETLNRKERAEDVRDSVNFIFSQIDLPRDSGKGFVYAFSFQGLEAMVVGYSLTYGGIGIPQSRIFIDGYRKVGLAYELVEEAGESFGDRGILYMEQLASPRLNEAWFLARGIAVSGMTRTFELVRIYSFDGYNFKELWAPDYRSNSEYKTTETGLVVTYEDEYGHRYKDTIVFTSAGPMASTEKLLEAR